MPLRQLHHAHAGRRVPHVLARGGTRPALPGRDARNLRALLARQPAGASPEDRRAAPAVQDDQVVKAVPVQVGGAELYGPDAGVREPLRLEAQIGLIEDAHALGPLPGRARERQIDAAVAVEVAGRHRQRPRRGQHLVPAQAPAGRRSVVDRGVHPAGVHAVVVIGDHQVVGAVAVQVTDHAAHGALGRQLRTGVAVTAVEHVGRRPLPVVLAVAEQQVQVAVPVHVELVDALQHARARHVQVLPAGAERAGAEGLEPLGHPLAQHLSPHAASERPDDRSGRARCQIARRSLGPRLPVHVVTDTRGRPASGHCRLPVAKAPHPGARWCPQPRRHESLSDSHASRPVAATRSPRRSPSSLYRSRRYPRSTTACRSRRRRRARRHRVAGRAPALPARGGVDSHGNRPSQVTWLAYWHAGEVARLVPLISVIAMHDRAQVADGDVTPVAGNAIQAFQDRSRTRTATAPAGST